MSRTTHVLIRSSSQFDPLEMTLRLWHELCRSIVATTQVTASIVMIDGVSRMTSGLRKEKLMTNTKLLIRLRDLHGELSDINSDLNSTEQIDEETVDALGQLVTDVGGLVDRAKVINDDSTEDEHQNVADRIIEFEAHHPRVTQFLSQLTDLLAMIGI